MKIITIKNLKINGKILNFIILMGEDMNKTLNENFYSKKDGYPLKRWLDQFLLFYSFPLIFNFLIVIIFI